MSKYKRGPYHYVEFCDESSEYHKHVADLIDSINTHIEEKRTTEDAVSLHEVGCGEGLILQQILIHFGWLVTGNDSDDEAARMAQLLIYNAYTTDDVRTIEPFYNLGPQVVLFSDSLEHIENWRDQLNWAKAKAEFVVIAVPDRHDAHGLRDFKIDSFDEIFKDWTCVHSATRHARHLLIFKK
jgi:hypothetical protein